jgi:hypothetical protein
MRKEIFLIAPTGLFLDFSGYVKANPRLRRRITEGLTEVIGKEEQFKEAYSFALISEKENEINSVALLRSSSKVATVRFRVKVIQLQDLDPPLGRREIEAYFRGGLGGSWEAYWSGQRKAIDIGDWGAVMEYITLHRPDVSQHLAELRKYAASLARRESSDLQQQEVDALATAYRLAGLSGHEGIIIAAARGDRGIEDLMDQSDFLVPLYEDAMLANDQRIFENWAEKRRYSYSSTVFSDGIREVQIYNVHRSKLEAKLGVDLIYHDLDRNLFVMVQYKRLAAPTEKGWGYYASSDTSLAKELAAMDRFERKRKAPDNGHVSDYRYNPDLFYFKFCPKMQSADGQLLTQGMYITKAHLQRMLAPENPSKLIHFPTGQGYFNNTLFIDLFKTGLIGCHAATAVQVQQLIAVSVGLGNSVLYAEARKSG